MKGATGAIELRHLRAFEAVSRLRSFTRAAAELSVTQPALSRTIQQFEHIVGITLLERNPRRIELTTAASVLLEHVRRSLAALDDGLAAARAGLRVRLGFSWLLPDPWAQQAVARFEAENDAAVALVRLDSEPLAALRAGDVDVVVLRGQHRSSSDVRVLRLFDEARVAVCSLNSPLATREEVLWGEIPRWPLVVNTVSGTTDARTWDADRAPRRIIETRNYDEWVESIAADRGVGVVPEVAARRHLHPSVTFLTIPDAPPIPVSLAWLPRDDEGIVARFVGAAAPPRRR